MYTSSLLEPLKHGFFTRKGGVSSGLYDSLSFFADKADPMENVRKNREIAMKRLGVEGRTLVTVNQVHGTHGIVVVEPWKHGQGVTPDADILVTQNPDVVLGVFTADCVPVLMYDEPTQTIAAVHSGWKGTQKNVVAAALGLMAELGVRPETVKAVLGPSIAQDNYEVGPEVYGGFTSVWPAYGRFFKPSTNPDKYMLDVSGVVHAQLQEAGVGQIEVMNLDTYSMEHEFFSCRRAHHLGEPGFGCMLSAIAL